MKNKMMAGLISAIYTTARIHRGQWEALRCLWLHGALTWDEFQWLEYLELTLMDRAKSSPFGITPIPVVASFENER